MPTSLRSSELSGVLDQLVDMVLLDRNLAYRFLVEVLGYSDDRAKSLLVERVQVELPMFRQPLEFLGEVADVPSYRCGDGSSRTLRSIVTEAAPPLLVGLDRISESLEASKGAAETFDPRSGARTQRRAGTDRPQTSPRCTRWDGGSVARVGRGAIPEVSKVPGRILG